VIFYTQVWKRPIITEMCFMGMQRLEKYFKRLTKVAVISEPWAEKLCVDYGIEYVYCSNDNIGKKHNVGLEYCLKFDWDRLIQFNSDTLLTDALIEKYLTVEVDLLGVDKCVFLKDKESKEVQYQTIIGAGRCLSRNIVEKCFPLWPENVEYGLDGKSNLKMIHAGATNKAYNLNGVYDMKSEQNIWNYDSLEGTEVEVDYNIIPEYASDWRTRRANYATN